MRYLRRYGFLQCFLLCLAAAVILPQAIRAESPRSQSATSPAYALSRAVGAQPGDWPMYGRDPQRTSYNPDETIIGAANVASLAQAWQYDIGMGPIGYPAFSAPSVANGMVYAASSRDTGDNMFALNVDDGSLVWTASIGYNPGECFGVGIGSTPAISGTMLVVGGGDAAYYGLNALTGDQIWRDPLDVGPSGFAWVSPLLANGRAYVGVASDCDNPSVRGEVRSVNYETGAHTGSTYIVPEGEAGGGIWNSPALSVDNSKLAVVTGEDYDNYNGPYNRAMTVINSDSMSITASNQQGSLNLDQDWTATPWIFHDHTGRALVAAGHKNGKLYVYDLNNVSAGPIWSKTPGTDTGAPGGYDPTLGGGGTLFYKAQQQNRLYALNPADGEPRWPALFVGSARGGIAIANGLIYINNDGLLKIVNEATGTLLRTVTPPNHGASNSGPVISNGTVYWVSGAYLNAWRIPGSVPTATPAPSATPTASPTPEPPPCPSEEFTDVCMGDYFYEAVHALKADGIVAGYNTAPPCNNSLWIPCFKPYNTSTRGQITKVVALAANLSEPAGSQRFEDVLPGSTFYTYTQQLAQLEIVGGYACGGAGEPCGNGNLPYFRSNNNVTRGQLAKIVDRTFGLADPVSGQAFQDVAVGSTFYEDIGRLHNRGIINGYACGGPGEPCGNGNLPYFRPSSDVTRGQTAKIIQLSRTMSTSTPTAAPGNTATPTVLATGTITITPSSTAQPTETPTGTPIAMPRP